MYLFCFVFKIIFYWKIKFLHNNFIYVADEQQVKIYIDEFITCYHAYKYLYKCYRYNS